MNTNSMFGSSLSMFHSVYPYLGSTGEELSPNSLRLRETPPPGMSREKFDRLQKWYHKTHDIEPEVSSNAGSPVFNRSASTPVLSRQGKSSLQQRNSPITSQNPRKGTQQDYKYEEPPPPRSQQQQQEQKSEMKTEAFTQQNNYNKYTPQSHTSSGGNNNNVSLPLNSPHQSASLSHQSRKQYDEDERKWNTIMHYDEELYHDDLIRQLEKEKRTKEEYKADLFKQMKEKEERNKKLTPAECAYLRQNLTAQYLESLKDEEKTKLKQRQKAKQVREEAMKIYHDQQLHNKIKQKDEQEYMMKTLEYDAEDYELEQTRQYLKKKMQEARYARDLHKQILEKKKIDPPSDQMLPEEYNYNKSLISTLSSSVHNNRTKLQVPSGYTINPKNPFKRLNHGDGILNPTYTTTMKLNDYIPPPKMNLSDTNGNTAKVRTYRNWQNFGTTQPFPLGPKEDNMYATIESLAEQRCKSAAQYTSPKYGRIGAQWYY